MENCGCKCRYTISDAIIGKTDNGILVSAQLIKKWIFLDALKKTDDTDVFQWK